MPYLKLSCGWCSRLIHSTDPYKEENGKAFHLPDCYDAWREYNRHKQESEDSNKPKSN